MELLGPEYSMSVSTLDGGTKVFFSRRLQEQQAGEDLIEKQNAEQGLMPIVGNEAAEYGYENENRAFTRWFLDGVQPELNFHAGRDVTELLMACYMSAEEERVIQWKPSNLQSYRTAAGQALSRREFGAVTASGLAASLFQRSAVTFGVQSYSFRDRPLADAITGMQKLGLRSCELWQNHVEPPKMPREELRRWRETVSMDTFHRVRDQLAKASIALSAYNISITDTFSDAELERAFDMTAALGAPLITSSSNIGDCRAHCASGRAAEDGRGHAQSLADRSQRVCNGEEPDRRDGEEPLHLRQPRHRPLHGDQ